MIYKFKFEVYNDDNSRLINSYGEQSGNFWWAFTMFMKMVSEYVIRARLVEK